MRRLLGAQLEYVAKVVEAHRRPFDAGSTDPAVARERLQLAGDYAKVIMQIIVSATVLIASFMLLKNANEQLQKAAIGFIGTVIGYWLR